MNHRRIVSLLPSATEIVCALGGGACLVGRSHECDYPAEVRPLPVVTESKLLPGGSREINEQVRNLATASISVYRIHEKRLAALKPDLIFTQAQCDVCAVSKRDLRRLLGSWIGPVPQMVSLSPARLAEVWEDIRRVAALLGAPDAGRDLLRALKGRTVDVIERACLTGRKPRVACLEWLDPLMGAGNWVPDLVQMAGGENLFGASGKHSGWLKWEQVRAADPEVLVLMPCGFDLERTQREAAALAGRPGWAELRAVRKRRVYVVDGNAGFNRPGPRLVESLESLGEMVHPGLYEYGHEGRFWKRFPA